ncbi:hypothetical protein [Dokdonia sp. Hel_I_53]|uniref:hypothetical protein n=1 Tax=Dokdonia sp. Hel_I_53 TaxID=1566287 RepID=UPI00119FA189|nr:hypothetical protein [Dokdonia sp. Hel_I_53]
MSESEELHFSIFISLITDGDYYTTSNLFKIERLINPKIIRILDKEFPRLEVFIENGNYVSRKVEEFIIPAYSKSK